MIKILRIKMWDVARAILIAKQLAYFLCILHRKNKLKRQWFYYKIKNIGKKQAIH